MKRNLAAILLCAVAAGCGGMETRPDTGGEEFLKMQREAQAAFDSGENARAEVLYKGLLRAAPNDAETWFRLGNLYARTDNPDQAVNAYLTCLSLNGNDARAWHNLGVVRLRQAWAALLRANTLTVPPEPINAMSADIIRALEKVPYLVGPPGRQARGEAGAAACAGSTAVRTHHPGQAPRRSSGQALVEYLILFPVLLLLVLGTIQIALIYQAKFTLNYATFVGARQGALKNANMTSIKDGVASGLAPLFMRWSGSGTPGLVDLTKARIIAAIEVFNPKTARVEIISPTQKALDDLKGSGTEIPNDNLMYRSGLGDGMSIQDANLLKIRVTYCVKLVVPFANRVIYSLVNGIQGVQNLAHEFAWTPATAAAPATPNMCSEISDLYAGIREQIDSMTGGSSIPGMGTVQSLANGFINLLPTTFPTIPGLNWNIGGMRIPVTAEAVVRMQSPVQSGGLP